MIVRFIITLMVAMAIVGNVSMSSLSPSTIDLSRKGEKKGAELRIKEYSPKQGDITRN
jgi:hypothetical protein